MSHVHRLVILRHAKADQVGPTDFERPLTERGHRDARAVGRWLREQGIRPDAALVSGALRTRETWQEAADEAGWTLEPDLDTGLFSAGSDTVLDLLRSQDEAVTTALVIGHNPTMGYLAQMFDDGESDADLGAALVTGFPTSAVAVFGYDGTWADLGLGLGRLVGFQVARAT